jgi:glycosyltransferase involved in cell wall biosynthesis
MNERASDPVIESPLVSCVMVTRDRPHLVCQSIRWFDHQDYAARELIIIDDSDRSLETRLRVGADGYVDDDPRIRYIRLPERQSLGAKRNLGCQVARGDIIAHWDDDDWMASWRLSYQVQALSDNRAQVCGLDKLYFYDPQRDQAWQYVYPDRARFWVAGATLCYRKAFWRENPFPNINVGEDTRFVWSGDARRMIALAEAGFYVATIHPGNTSQKRTGDPRYRSVPVEQIRNVMAGDFDNHAQLFKQ